ncbi:uncharacterized protein [Epargyreus clarus]|uniref:uncharacterized protein n=1 Tax=Epargyreus clarus TaxID=520877 RepID=UPI003C2AB90A
MEAVQEHVDDSSVADVVKSNTVENEEEGVAVAADLCHKSNGVAEIGEAGQPEAIAGGDEVCTAPHTVVTTDAVEPAENPPVAIEASEADVPNETDKMEVMDISAQETDKTDINETSVEAQPKEQEVTTIEVSEIVTEVVIDDGAEKEVYHDVDIIEVGDIEASSEDIPKFNTEILIEANDGVVDTPEDKPSSETDSRDTSNNILSEFGESIELSEVLRSSDVTEISENNNSSVRQEVFNKEELLYILEGNDVEPTPPPPPVEGKGFVQGEMETKLALQQLSRLKNDKRKYKRHIRLTKVKKEKKTYEEIEKTNHIKVDGVTEKQKSNQTQSDTSVEDDKISNSEVQSNVEKKKTEKESQADNIVNVLVMDWDDEEQEPNESDVTKEIVVQSETVLNETENLKKNIETIANQEKPSIRASVDSVPSEDQAQRGKSGDESQPQRRLGRVIKKKVIFDPDNPDTFTKTKTKNRESIKELGAKEQPPIKKGKLEQTPQRAKSKSPMSNLQWKKPSSKNSKQNKRLTEVDRLLMDEGAVNMIYQLTPEAPKGKKSRETKAEFIKKIQSSTPDSKEMKFRERKKEKYEDGEAKKILGLKHRVSLNNSMKSPSVSEDFETHSADDSIIYRRHSSSSYSSSCMSPRRLSDVDSNSTQTHTRSSKPSSDNQTTSQTTSTTDNVEQGTDVFMSDSANKSSSEIINKEDYLSIKEKLNCKLSLALNKRKRESIKNEKPPKQKKVTRSEEKSELKYVTVRIDQRLAEICIEKTGLQHNVEVLKEMEQALAFIDSLNSTSVTLLTTDCSSLCVNLDLTQMKDEKTKSVDRALEVADAIRSVLAAVDRHSKLVCSGVRGACGGVGLALAALSDVVLASERASFALAAPAGPRAPPQPAAAALLARCRLPHSVVNDLILFGRQLSASEALQGGLVSRVLWPERFTEQVHNIVKDIAAEPAPTVMLKKQLISLKKVGENEQTFLSCLDTERDIFVEYWTSVEGQELLRAHENTA